MIPTKTNQTQINLEHLAGLYQVMNENHDSKNANKILDIFEKFNKQEFIISFAGHFSAGKSSMINGILGKSILPKSPIPTSANVVKIKSGNGNARVYFHDEAPLEYKEPYDIDLIKEYAQDKASIKEIEINTSGVLLPEDCMLIDTPGIDAADDADRLITESSLHLVDALFYVMDYNHVQSDVNLQFLKKLQDYQIPFYIIVNQIDKHDESEIMFKMFDKKIKQTFDQWGINPEGLFYSSLVNTSAPHNQFPEIKHMLSSLMNSQNNLISNATRSVNQITKEHKQFLNKLYEKKLAEASTNESDRYDNVSVELEEIDRTIADLKTRPARVEDEFYKDLNTTLKNAYLMPSELRNKAEQFLESQQDDFKVGLFSTKKKTEEERNVRLESFLEHLSKNAEASIQWKLRDKFSNILKRYNIYDQTILQQVQELSITYNAEAVLTLLKPGAKVNGDYVLNYTNDVSFDLKKRYKKEAQKLWDIISDSLHDEMNNQLCNYENERKQLYFVYEKQQSREKLEKELQDNLQYLESVLANPEPDEHVWGEIDKALNAQTDLIKQADGSYKESKPDKDEDIKESQQPNDQSTISAGNILNNIEKAIHTIEGLPGFQSIVNDLIRKKERLDNRTYTIVLFGAFSAGKSSFVNALIGINVLPVSPNPTTAVINRINPVTDERKHGTVAVKLKNELTLVEDILFLTKNFSPKGKKLERLVSWVKENNIHNSEQLHKTHQSYLNAVINGYDNNKDKLGQEIFINLDDFADYVTDETKACYIEVIDLYYDCSLTKEGITLVDTPGADSVNARHTNVAFDYIKYADAILYVTYYNHALSRADMNFLMQLGRVKDTFQLDKMFFIMNAADLAESNSERNMVMNYVENELSRLGIRFPRLFPVSSKQSLKEKLNNEMLNQQMKTFEDSFNSFIHNELAAIAIHSAIRDIYRASQMVGNFIDSSQLNAKEKEQFCKEMYSEQTALKRLADQLDNDVYVQKVTQKMEKQLYYVLERLSIRFHDMFKETFNPATITANGKDGKQQLENSLRTLLDYAGYELMQELRAVSLRIETLMSDLRNDVHHDYTNLITQTNTEFTLPDFADTTIETPDYVQAFKNLDPQVFHKALKDFNGTKAFFAKNEKETMKENLFKLLSPLAEEYINNNHQMMKDSYIGQWNAIMKAMKLEIDHNIDRYIANHLSMVSDESINIDTLNEKKNELALILKEHEQMEMG